MLQIMLTYVDILALTNRMDRLPLAFAVARAFMLKLKPVSLSTWSTTDNLCPEL